MGQFLVIYCFVDGAALYIGRILALPLLSHLLEVVDLRCLGAGLSDYHTSGAPLQLNLHPLLRQDLASCAVFAALSTNNHIGLAVLGDDWKVNHRLGNLVCVGHHGSSFISQLLDVHVLLLVSRISCPNRVLERFYLRLQLAVLLRRDLGLQVLLDVLGVLVLPFVSLDGLFPLALLLQPLLDTRVLISKLTMRLVLQ